MVTPPYELKILEWDDKPQIKQINLLLNTELISRLLNLAKGIFVNEGNSMFKEIRIMQFSQSPPFLWSNDLYL